MSKVQSLPESFSLEHDRVSLLTYRLKTSQLIPLDRERTFEFFKDPRNLSLITPDWLDFRLVQEDAIPAVGENAEFDYTIQWFGFPIAWKSRITSYNPPLEFTDIQVKGPYRSWVHRHLLLPVPGGTRMDDTVTYKLPLSAWPLHRILIKKHLREIFTYRAIEITHWVDSVQRTSAATRV